MQITATILRIDQNGMLVRNRENGQEVYVNFANARNFRVGDTVRITSTGTMTFSIPPQITASNVVLVPQVPPSTGGAAQTAINRAQILRIERNSMLVRDPANGRQVRVRYPHVHHFCTGQRVNIRYDTITFGNPTEVNATDVFPIC